MCCLRQLHDEMDRAVLDAYGWTDIQPKCEFVSDFDDEEDEEENGRHEKEEIPIPLARRGS